MDERSLALSRTGCGKCTTFDSDAVHIAAMTLVVVNRFVPCRAIIPHSHVTVLPAYATLEFRFLTVGVEAIQDRI